MSEQERKGGNFAVQEESLIRLPLVLQQVLNRLHRAGFSAYAVGGCVRDSLLGRIPKDWDVTTSAKPEEVAAVFSDAKVLPTGIRHGTVTLLTDEMPIEITTFRSEGSYSDHRRPDEVTFLEKPDQDLARRDFTINAMAYHSKEGLLDLFGGRAHLKQKIVCCVGDPIARFREDALRILRAMRFASELDFTIEEKTAKAMKECRNLLSAISPERIYAELVKLLCGAGAGRVLSLYGEVLLPVLPELEPMFDCKQNSPYHDKSVWEHTIWVIDALPGEKVLRLVALFHDMGKPALKTTDKEGIDHFKGHPEQSAHLAEQILRRLRADNATIKEVCHLVRCHDLRFENTDASCRKLLHRLGKEHFSDYLTFRRADTFGQSDRFRAVSNQALDLLEERGKRLLAEEDCFSLWDLKLKGEDLLSLGFEGEEIGRMLANLLDQVLDGRLKNQKETLLAAAKEQVKRK